MKKLVVTAALVGFMGATSAALAAEATGVITGVDAANGTITLNNGQTFALANQRQDSGPSVAENFRPGDKVQVIYRQLNDQPTATAITPRG
jgi:Cu/Ag efflux protein CusF